MNTPQELKIGVGWQMPGNRLHSAFGELNLTRRENSLDVSVTILMEPVREGSQTGVALDGSHSMQHPFGQGFKYSSDFTVDTQSLHLKKKTAKYVDRDGQRLLEFTREGWNELLAQKLVVPTENVVEPIAREVIPYLAEKIDADGGTTVIHWACGSSGKKIDVVGDMTAEEAKKASYEGPADWGAGTHLLPAVRYFVERFAEAKWGFYVFVTDGRIDDLKEVKEYTVDLARRIGCGQANPVKFVLIGVGPEVDEQQMIELDDLPDAMDLDVDLWDHKVAATMRGLRDIFAEVVDENAMVAPTGRVLCEGHVVANFSDGLPALIKFSLPLNSKSFVLDVAGQEIEQTLF